MNTSTTQALTPSPDPEHIDPATVPVPVAEALGRVDPVLLARRPETFPPLGDVDRALWSEGVELVCGTDEAGAGPLAGPVVAAAVTVAAGVELPAALTDSKLMPERAREEVLAELTSTDGVKIILEYGSPARIDADGIRVVNLRLMRAAVRSCLHHVSEDTSSPQAVVLSDAHALDGLPYPTFPLVKGDQRSLAVAAASVAAKVSRDRYMVAADERYPGYGFAQHKGYGTAAHREAIRNLGPCPEHRKSFRLI